MVGRGVGEECAPCPGIEHRQRTVRDHPGGLGKGRVLVAEADRAALQPESAGIRIPDEAQRCARKAAVADLDDAFRVGRETALDAEPARGFARLAERRREIEREAGQIARDAQLRRSCVSGAREVDGRLPGRLAADPRKKRGVAGGRRLDEAGTVEPSGQQARRQAAVDGQARRVGRFGSSADDGADRLAEPGRGEVAGFDCGAADRDRAVHRREPLGEPWHVDPVVFKGDPAVDGDRPAFSGQGNRQIEVDGAVAAYRETIDHRREPCPQRALGEEAHGIGARARDAGLDLRHRRLGAQILDGDRALAEGRFEDAARVETDIEPRAVQCRHGRHLRDLRPAAGVAEHRDGERRAGFERSRSGAGRGLRQVAVKRQPRSADGAFRDRRIEPAQHRLRNHAVRDQGAGRGDPRSAQGQCHAQLGRTLVRGHERPAFGGDPSHLGGFARGGESHPQALRRMRDGEGAGELFAFQGLRKPAREARTEPAGHDLRHEPLRVRLEPSTGRMDGDRPVLPADAEPGKPAAGAGAFEFDALGDRHRDPEGFDRAARSGLEQGAQRRARVRVAFRRRERDDVLDTRELRVDDQRSLAALARRRPLHPGAGDRPGSVGGGDGEVAHGERPALRMTLDRERSARLVEPSPAPLVHDTRREGVDRSLRLDEPAVLPRAPCLAGHDAGDLLRPREQAAEAKAGEIDVVGGDVCGAGPWRGGTIAGQIRREVDPAAPGGLERTGDAVPIAGVLEMQGHAVERQRRQAALLVDPHDARREQRDPRLARHPPHETADPSRLGRRAILELPDRQRSIGAPYEGERRTADGDVARLQGPRPEQIERIDREPEIGDPD